jgi:hypothetical protein
MHSCLDSRRVCTTAIPAPLALSFFHLQRLLVLTIKCFLILFVNRVSLILEVHSGQQLGIVKALAIRCCLSRSATVYWAALKPLTHFTILSINKHVGSCVCVTIVTDASCRLSVLKMIIVCLY